MVVLTIKLHIKTEKLDFINFIMYNMQKFLALLSKIFHGIY